MRFLLDYGEVTVYKNTRYQEMWVAPGKADPDLDRAMFRKFDLRTGEYLA